MSLKVNSWLIIILALGFPFKIVAQENNGGAAELQNISSPNGLEEIVPKIQDTRGENETIYQIQKKPKNPDKLSDNSDEENNNSETETETETENETGIFRIRL